MPSVSPESESMESNNKEQTAYEEIDNEGTGVFGYLLIFFSILLCFPLFFIAIPISVKTIKEYERGVILRLGKVKRWKGRTAILGSGVRFVLPCTDVLLIADLRIQSFNIPPQEVLTKDAVSVKVDAVVYMKIFDPAAALLRVENVYASAKMTAVSMLRNVIGQYELAELLQNRQKIDSQLRSELDDATDAWGIKVERVDITDVSLPGDMQRAMAAEAQAARQAKAKVITAKGELEASESLTEAASAFDKNPSALHLRFLQTLNTIASEKNSTVIFPLPMEILRFFQK